jgi:hypothetical protein
MKNQLPGNTTQLTPADITSIVTKINDCKTLIAPVVIEIAPGQKKMYPQGGQKKEGTMTMAHTVAIAHPEIMPTTFEVAKIDAYLKSRAVMGQLRDLIGDLYKALDDSYTAYGILASNETNIIYGYLQMAAENDPSLRQEEQELGKFFKKGARKGYTEISIAPAGEADFDNAIPGDKVINTGKARLLLKNGADLSGKVKRVDPITIEPGSSADVPPGYTSIVITNLSATDGGSFEIKLKAPKK